MAKARKAMVPPEKFAALTDGLNNHCGFDLGKRIDLSGAAAVFDLPDGRIGVKMHGFMPENGAERHEKTDPGALQGLGRGRANCTLTPGDRHRQTAMYITGSARESGDLGWKVDEVDYDGHNATDLAIRMNEDRNPGGLLRGGGSDLRRAESGGEDPSGSCCSRTGWSSRRAPWPSGASRTPLRSRTTMGT